MYTTTVSSSFIQQISSKIYFNTKGQQCLPFFVGQRLSQLQHIYDDPVYRVQIKQRCGACSFFFSSGSEIDGTGDAVAQNKISFMVNISSVTDEEVARQTLLLSAVSLFHHLNEDLKITKGCGYLELLLLFLHSLEFVFYVSLVYYIYCSIFLNKIKFLISFSYY